jgi:peptidoglycan-associated lipoprotein
MNTFIRVATLAALVIVGACAKDKTKADDSSSGSSSYGNSTDTGSAADSIVGTPTATGAGAGGTMPSGNVLYFEFDSSELSQADQTLVQAWGAYLAANPGMKGRLEGHTDERGTREYNVALGERRANAVLQALTSRSVSERQLGISSFGEERPVAMGHDESAWSQNRRVEIVK